MVEMRRWMIGLVVVGVVGLTGCGSASNSTPVAGSTGSTGSSAPVAGSVSGSAPNTPSTTISASTPSPSSTLSSPPPPASGTTSTGTATPITSGTATSPFGATPSRKPGARLTLTGTVEAGVEASCLVLEDEKTGLRVNLTSGEKAVVRVGARITVVGQLRNDLMSYCQQGPVFVVIKAVPA